MLKFRSVKMIKSSASKNDRKIVEVELETRADSVMTKFGMNRSSQTLCLLDNPTVWEWSLQLSSVAIFIAPVTLI